MPILRIGTESQSYQEIAALVGPQGPAGADGAPGQDGADGAPGEQGPAGPNEVSASTATSFNGLLKGNGSVVAQAQAGTGTMLHRLLIPPPRYPLPGQAVQRHIRRP